MTASLRNILYGANHIPHIEKPAETAALIAAFPQGAG